MIYCDIMEKRHREYRWFLLKFDCMDLYTRSDGSNKEKRRIKNQRNEKKLQEEREKEEGKKRRKNFEVLYICCYGNSMYVFLCPCCLLIISCVASVLSSFTLSWVVTIHCTSLVLPHSFSAAVFSVFCCSMFDRVLLFEIACSSWGSPYQHQHLHKVY